MYYIVLSHFREDWISFTQRSFVSGSVEVGQVVLKEKILKCRQCIFAIAIATSIISKGMALHLPNLNPLQPAKDALCQSSLVEIGLVVLERKIKNVKSLQIDSQMTDSRWEVNLSF